MGAQRWKLVATVIAKPSVEGDEICESDNILGQPAAAKTGPGW